MLYEVGRAYQYNVSVLRTTIKHASWRRSKIALGRCPFPDLLTRSYPTRKQPMIGRSRGMRPEGG